MAKCWITLIVVVVVVAPAESSDASPAKPRDPEFGIARTFSIVAIDPQTGIAGAAVASKYPAVGKAVAFARGGVGAFCTQYWVRPPLGKIALDLLEKGKAPEEVLGTLVRGDIRRGKRQLAIIDRRGRTANLNPHDADRNGLWWGALSGRYYSCQGNTLTGSEVVVDMARAYENTKGSLADRLMAALVAGDCAGGDHRGRLAAGIRVARPGVRGYWLELHTDRDNDAVISLLKKYVALKHPAKGKWAGGQPPFKHPCPNRPKPRPPQQP